MLVSARILSVVFVACFLGSLVACEVVRRFAVKRALLDSPNERSLHAVPIPRLGGVGIVVTTLAAYAAGWTASPASKR